MGIRDNAIDVNIIEAGSEHTEEFYNQLDGKLAAFADKLSSNLSEEVIDDEERHLIGKTQTILDVKDLLTQLRRSNLSPEIFASNHFPIFAEAAAAMHAHGMSIITSDLLERQYRKFVAAVADLSPDDLSDDLDPREILQDLFSEKKKLFRGLSSHITYRKYSSHQKFFRIHH